MFTFMKDPFWNSGVMVPHNIKQTALEAELMQKEKWMTPEGFQFPGMNSALGDNEPELPLDEQRLEEIRNFVSVPAFKQQIDIKQKWYSEWSFVNMNISVRMYDTL